MKTIFFWDFCVAKAGKKPPLGPFYAANLFFTLRFVFLFYSILLEVADVYYHTTLSKTATNVIGIVLCLIINELAEKSFKKHEQQMERDYKKLSKGKIILYRTISIGSIVLLLLVVPYVLRLLHI